MPENYFINPNLNNQDNTNPVPEPQPEPKFTPPPPNIFIRTSETDLTKMQGNEPVTSFSSPAPESSSKETFIPQTPPSNITPETTTPFINIENQPVANQPVFDTNSPISPADLANLSQPPQPKKTNKLIPIIIIVATVIIGAVVGYFLLFPKFFAKTPKTTTTTATITEQNTTTTTTTTLPPSLFPRISPPYEKQSIVLTIPAATVVSSFKNTVTQQTAASQTFTILIPKFQDYVLSSDEIISALIPKLPDSLKAIVTGRKTLVYAYYGNVNPSLGLIIDIGQDKVELAKAEFANWEKAKILSELSNFWIIKPPTKTTSKTFKAETINGADIRYMPYSGKEAALGYAFFGDYLIISSSLESINSAVTHLQGATELIYP